MLKHFEDIDLRKLLIIDDEKDFCQLLKLIFSKGQQFTVEVSNTLKDGFKALEMFRPDIILLDNNLPDGKGWEYKDKITKQLPDSLLVLMSAYQPVNVDSGKTIYMEKPISISKLKQKFEEHVPLH